MVAREIMALAIASVNLSLTPEQATQLVFAVCKSHGWQLVPIEPSEKMRLDGLLALGKETSRQNEDSNASEYFKAARMTFNWKQIEAAYTAMLKAASEEG